jgi:hypothetical protein
MSMFSSLQAACIYNDALLCSNANLEALHHACNVISATDNTNAYRLHLVLCGTV